MYGDSNIEKILNDQQVIQLKEKIVNHIVYKNITTKKDVNIFMEHHIFQVWDFMILLKSIQFGVNPIMYEGNLYPWIPRVPGAYSKLITEICLEEENDPYLANLSHFDYYLKGMNQADADIYNIEESISYVRDYKFSLEKILFPSNEVKEHFVYMYNISNIKKAPMDLVFRPLVSFCICREGFIPSFFTPILKNISKKERVDYEFFINYLDRHIELDGEEHSEKALELLGYFLSDENCTEALEIVIKSLELRLGVLDCINNKIITKNYENEIG